MFSNNCTKCCMTEAGGNMVHGTYALLEFDTREDFPETLSTLRTNEALVYGVPKGRATGMIVTKAKLESMPEDKRQGHIARSNDHFEWSDGRGIFMIDIDPPAKGEALAKNAAISIVRDVAPELKDVPMLWYPSSSTVDTNDDLSFVCSRPVRTFTFFDRCHIDYPNMALGFWMSPMTII